MHRLSSRSSVHRFRLAALLWCIRYMLALASVSALLYSFLMNDRELTLIGIGMGTATLLSILFHWMISARTRCPLCLTPVLANRKCSKHRNARRLLGSHRLWVSLAILFKGSFRCPYCHEPTAVEARPKRPGYPQY